jgi:anthraniloyl-CoA monooxygenase
MKIVSIGGGPGGLYFAILMKKAFPEAEIVVHERNRADDTFGWGVVFSDETLSGFEEADPESFREITTSFRYWGDIETYYGGQCVTSTGHGFCGMSRKKLLNILQARCRDLGVDLRFESEISDVESVRDADLVLGADGVNSMVRDRYERSFRPSLDWRPNRFCWLGTNRPLEAFTFIFEENEHGLWMVHAYPFQNDLSTWIVECDEETWLAAGMDTKSEDETVAYCQELFAKYLDGHFLLANRSLWRQFPTIKCASWSHENVVLVGDAVHTAHFSIGSGTKLAMEDAIALVDAFKEHGTHDVERVLAAYQDSREIDTLKLQKAAQTSLEWFENARRYMEQDPLQLSFNLMTRSKRITYDNLRLRDPDLVARVSSWYREHVGAPKTSEGADPPPMFTPYRLRDMELANRVVVSPMCQYSAVDGVPNDWHVVHLGSRAIGGAGLVITEMTDVEPEGRITSGCTGLWNAEQRDAWKRIVDFVHHNSHAKIGIQLAHAGRKGSCAHPWEGHDVPLPADEAWTTYAPSPLPFLPDWPVPKEMDRADMDRVRDAFVHATRLADEAGFDLVEVHMAHGYLLNEFLSPVTNLRTDEYGGSLENRMRYPLEVLRAAREAWPDEKPLAVRISAVDWVEGGQTADESVALARALQEAGCDVLDVSTSGISADAEPIYGRMFQVPFADRIRHETGMPVMTVGAILGADHCNTILAAGRADLCAMARPHLRSPYLTLDAASEYDYPDQHWPGQYLLGKPPRPAG